MSLAWDLLEGGQILSCTWPRAVCWHLTWAFFPPRAPSAAPEPWAAPPRGRVMKRRVPGLAAGAREKPRGPCGATRWRHPFQDTSPLRSGPSSLEGGGEGKVTRRGREWRPSRDGGW